MTNNEDRSWLRGIPSASFFGDFIDAGAAEKFYYPIEDLANMKTSMEGYLEDYNQLNAVRCHL